MKNESKRWKAFLMYNEPKKGKIITVEEVFCFDEYVELGDHIERGPDWNLLVKVEIVHNPSK